MNMSRLSVVEYFAYFAFLLLGESEKSAESSVAGESALHQSAEHEVGLYERDENEYADDPFPDVVRDFLTLLRPHAAVDVVDLFRVGGVVEFEFAGHSRERKTDTGGWYPFRVFMQKLEVGFGFHFELEVSGEVRSYQHAHRREDETGELWGYHPFRIGDFEGYPRHDSENHRQHGSDGVGFFPVHSGEKRNHCSREGDLVRVFHHAEDAGFAIEREERDEASEDYHGPLDDVEEFRVADVLEVRLQDVFHEHRRRSEEGSGSGGHDCRKERSEEHHLHEHGRMVQYEVRQNELRIAAFGKGGLYHLRIHERCRVREKDRYERENEVEASSEYRRAARGFFVLRGHDPLKYVLLRDGSESQSEEGSHEGEHAGIVQCPVDLHRRKRIQHAVVGCGFQHASHSLRHEIGDVRTDDQHSDHDDDHLEEVGHRYRPHASEERVRHDDGGSGDHSGFLGDGSSGEGVEHDAEGDDLRAHPSEIRQHDGDGREHLNRTAVLIAVKIANGQVVSAIEGFREEESDENEAQRSAEGVGHDSRHAFGNEGGRRSEHRFGSKPSREHRRRPYVQGEVASCDDVVLRILYFSGGEEAYGDGRQYVESYEKRERGHCRNGIGGYRDRLLPCLLSSRTGAGALKPEYTAISANARKIPQAF